MKNLLSIVAAVISITVSVNTYAKQFTYIAPDKVTTCLPEGAKVGDEVTENGGEGTIVKVYGAQAFCHGQRYPIEADLTFHSVFSNTSEAPLSIDVEGNFKQKLITSGDIFYGKLLEFSDDDRKIDVTIRQMRRDVNTPGAQNFSKFLAEWSDITVIDAKFSQTDSTGVQGYTAYQVVVKAKEAHLFGSENIYVITAMERANDYVIVISHLPSRDFQNYGNEISRFPYKLEGLGKISLKKTYVPTMTTYPSGNTSPGIANDHACTPAYPRASLLKEEQGTVKVRYTVSPQGALLDSTIIESSGFPNLDQAVLDSLPRCKFHPKLENGVPVQSGFDFKYTFGLKPE